MSVDTPRKTKHTQLFTTNRELFEMYEDHFKSKNPYDLSSGIDLLVPRDIVIETGTDRTVEIDFDVSICIVDNLTGHIIPSLMYPRSSLSKSPLRLANSVGVIDIGYTGNIRGIFDVKGTIEVVIKKGSRLTQICVGNLEPCSIEIVFGQQDNNTTRGKNGFGSSGGTI
jgi:dUTP pyrophosphatase